MRIGVVGYGAGGQYFHTPFIAAAQGVDLVGVVTRSPQRRAAVAADWPGIPTYDSLGDLLAAGVDAASGGNRSRIADGEVRVRNELAPLRRRMR